MKVQTGKEQNMCKTEYYTFEKREKMRQSKISRTQELIKSIKNSIKNAPSLLMEGGIFSSDINFILFTYIS